MTPIGAASAKQLWVLAGGNGAGKSTFYRLALAPLGIRQINADVIAKLINSENPEKVSYEAAAIAERIREAQLQIGTCFCYETVFSHPSKIDFIASAKGLGYEIVLIYIHLQSPQLNEARVWQRVSEGGHDVAAEKIHARIPRTMQHIAKALPLADEVRLLDNSAYDNPFQQIAIVKQSVCCRHITPLPDWARQIMVNIPHRHT